MKLIDLEGLTYMSPTNSFLSMTSPVLFVSSHTTLKSTIPLLPCTSLKKGSTRFLNCDLVNASLNSNNENLDAVDIAFSNTMKSLLTLILSNADGLPSNVLSPNKIVPCPGNVTTGLISALYSKSLSAFFGLNASLTRFLIAPLLYPAGENQASLSSSLLTARPAMSPFSGTYLYTSLNLSY